MPQLPKFVQINEEGPREGFQIEKGPISTSRKIELVDALSKAGLSQIQVCSFVDPRRVPGMADAEEIARGFHRVPGIRYTALWLNDRGFERAVAVGKLDLVGNIALTASEKFLKRNQNRTFDENLVAQRVLIEKYKKANLSVERAGIMAAFGCNYQGEVPKDIVLNLVQQISDLDDEYELGIKVLSLADTMAWATPQSIKSLVVSVRERFPRFRINLHLHDTRGLGIANAYAGLEVGVDSFDAAVAGLGGCPFAANQGAAGNVCTEDLAFLCAEMGIETGIDLEQLIEAAKLAEEIVGHSLPGNVKQAGLLARAGKMQ